MESVLRRFQGGALRNLLRRRKPEESPKKEDPSESIYWHLEYRYDNRYAGVPISTKYNSFMGTKAEIYEKLRELRAKEERDGVTYEVELFPDLTSALKNTQGKSDGHVHFTNGVYRNHRWEDCPEYTPPISLEERQKIHERHLSYQKEQKAKYDAYREQERAREDEKIRSDPEYRRRKRAYITDPKAWENRAGTRGANSTRVVDWKKKAVEEKMAKRLREFNEKYGED